MSAQVVLILVLVAVVAAVVLGSVFDVNMGFLALVFACLIGGFYLGVKPSTLYSYWPASIVVQIIGVTFFYGFVNETGAIQALTRRIIYVTQNKFWLMPFIFFLLPFALGYVGVLPMGINAIVLPIIAGICMYTNRSPFFLYLVFTAGSSAGLISPLGTVGIVASGMITSVLGDSASGVISRLFINNIIFCLIMFVIWYIVFRGWGIKINDASKEQLTQKPEPMTKPQKQVLTIMFITVAVLIIFSLCNITIISTVTDIGWIYALAGVVCVFMKLADQRVVISKHIPWGIIILVSGFTILLTLLTENGASDLISGAISSNISAKLVAPLLGLLSGITSFFSDGIAVVIPLYLSIGAGTLSSGVSATALFSAIIIAAMATGCAPFSTGGAMLLSFTPESIRKKMFWVGLIEACIFLVVIILLTLIGVFG